MSSENERIARLETQMEAVLKMDGRLTRLERVMWFVGGAAAVGGLGGAPTLISMILGG